MNIATTNSDPEQGPARLTTCNRTIAGILWLAGTTLTYLISLWLLKHHADWSPGTRVAITLAPLLPGILYLRTLLKSFWQMDELQRRIQIEGLGLALVGTLVVMTAMNIFTAEGFRLVNYPQGLGIGGVYLTMFILWSIGVSISTFRYR
ncbi:MAG: hypothetical protein ABIR38_01460 [Chthoniobacterales bacterium]